MSHDAGTVVKLIRKTAKDQYDTYSLQINYESLTHVDCSGEKAN